MRRPPLNLDSNEVEGRIEGRSVWSNCVQHSGRGRRSVGRCFAVADGSKFGQGLAIGGPIQRLLRRDHIVKAGDHDPVTIDGEPLGSVEQFVVDNLVGRRRQPAQDIEVAPGLSARWRFPWSRGTARPDGAARTVRPSPRSAGRRRAPPARPPCERGSPVSTERRCPSRAWAGALHGLGRPDHHHELNLVTDERPEDLGAPQRWPVRVTHPRLPVLRDPQQQAPPSTPESPSCRRAGRWCHRGG
ncbi:MAG: hypothetical protein JWM47_353 [Acidimicrobiales bacterium]|nr:hypothetical protein [Acidimicrobiales bacterium]